MNKVLVIYAHPNKDGHCGAILKAAETELKQKEQEYELIDLYAVGYNPVLLREEHYTSGHKNISEENKSYQQKIKEAEKMIFIFPTWWNGMPAILKGFFDRVFVSGFAFYYKNKMPVGLLQGKKAVIITSTGAPRFVTWLVMKDASTKVLAKNILGFPGIKAKAFYISKALKFSSDKETAIKATVKKGLAYLGI